MKSDKIETGNHIHTSSLIRRKDFTGFDPKLKRFQDWDLWLTMLEDSKIGIHIPKVLFTITAKGNMSSWLPSFAYRLMPWTKEVDKYNEARSVIIRKHKLDH